MKKSTTTTRTSRAAKVRTTRAKAVSLIPTPTHWIEIEDNHAPLDVMCLIDLINVDGDHELEIGYKSSKTNAWTAVTSVAIEQENRVLRYSIITNGTGVAWPAP